ncbi:hypothetical protein A1O1_00616 [Capronia coronata CBS 617.96]|uniref:DNA-binding protein RAP1 n=1 Tax=Capronia coronata CBS 617.96 TaxID=1182541 RepID=W9ZLX9_9EURO|nr:uncharacterized protein A1O1_00616 [Capronia coronata CBS 617.96]EXJ95494.1 hypothetical protein A1O1_00616 [Capronia coronata CBS 617.96]
MTSHIVYDGVPRSGEDGEHNGQTIPQLFAGQKLWFHHQIPQRKWLIDNARRHGATVVDLDKQADVRLVDHTKKNHAPGTHSYRYVELSIRKGALENLADHAVGAASRATRPVGSIMTAPRTVRMHFTPEEDQFLWNWMKPFEDSGGPSKGNEIYKQIERVSPRHTWQSWRDRWLKTTKFQNRQTTLQPGDAHEQPEEETLESSYQSRPKKRRRDVDDEGDRERVPGTQQQRQRSVTAAADVLINEQAVEPRSGRPTTDHVEGSIPPKPSPQKCHSPDASKQGTKQPAPSEPAPGVSSVREDFSLEEFEQLYNMVPKLAHISFSIFHDTWMEVASTPDHCEHTAEEWEEFWISKVVPVYCEKKGLSIREVAPYLLEQPEKTSNEVPRARERDEAGGHDPRPDTGPDKNVCSNCFTDESKQWRVGKDGTRLCNPCAVFLRAHGVPRPSTTGAGWGSDDRVRTMPTVKTSLAQSPLSDLTVAIPSSTYVSRGQTSPATKKEDSASNQSVSRQDCHLSPPPKSPSFQPESPTLDRRPEPNEARKRSAGRGTQSQSTESSTNPASQAPLRASLSLILETALEEGRSTKRAANHVTSSETHLQGPSAAAPASLLSSKLQGSRALLLDDPRNPDVEQKASLNTDQGPSRDMPVTHFTGSSGDVPLQLNQNPTPTALYTNSRRDESPLFFPEDEEDNEEYEDPVESSADKQQTNDRPSSPLSAPDHGLESGENFHHVVPLRWVQPAEVMERFETAEESLEHWETAPEDQDYRRKRQPTTQDLFEDPEIGSDAMGFNLDLPEPEGGWDTILGSADADLLAEYSELANPDVEESGSPHAGHPNEVESIQSDSIIEQILIPPPPPSILAATTGSDDDTDTEAEARELDEFIALHKSLHPYLKGIELLLFKVLEATIFDLDLATRVVEIMLADIRRQYSRRRSNSLVVDEIRVPRNMKGVWTEEDDNLLTSANGRDVERAIKKHGQKGCNARFEYLEKIAVGG